MAAAAVIDTAYLAASLVVPEPTIQTLLDAPTIELVTSVLQAVEAKSRELDALKADKLKSDIELENAVRSGDARARALKASVDKGLKDVEELRKKLHEEESTRASLETELQQLRSSSTNSTSEVQTLQARISALEVSNRETLALLENKSSAHDRLAEELSSQHQKIVSLRREVTALEERNQALENASTSTKFREQTLQQELDLLKKNNEWYEGELHTIRTKHSEFRKEKNGQISELQRINEDSTQTIESLRRTETTLRARLEDVNQKAEDGLSRIQQLQEAAAKAEEAFRMELDSAQRLADLQKQSADTARARLQAVQTNLEKTTEDAAVEIGQMQAEIETERAEKEAAEQKIAELELQVEQLEAAVTVARSNPTVPETPRRSVNGTLATPSRMGSPFTPNTARRKGIPTSTELYAQLSQTQAELETEKRKNQRLSTTVEDMLNELESKQPEIEEMRNEQDRLTTEVAEMSTLLEEANKEREAANKEARKRAGQVEGLQREADILRQQLRDMSVQIKFMLVEMQAREQGLQALDAEGQEQLKRLAQEEIGEEALAGMTDTGRFISERLTIFRNVKELQEQNMSLLRITRELGEQMEGEEAKAKANEREQERQELEQLRESVSSYQDQIHSLVKRAESFVKERDMFRRILAHRGHIPAGSDLQSMFAQSVDGRALATPPPGSVMESIEQSPRSKELTDYAKLIRDMQSHFDAYRNEAAADALTLKQQADKLAKEKSELHAKIAQISSQLSLEHDRYELLRANIEHLKAENAELQKRSQSLAETAAKQDIRTQQAVEDLAEYKSLADSKITEIANLKAEKELLKKIEARLSEDNRVLMDEKTRLNKMFTDLQNLQNEREHSDAETRRRLQARAESLESELQTVKRKLEDEIEDGKKAVLRREYESEQNRTRIDDLVKSLGNTREELIAAQTQRDQLQARVEELKIDLRNAEEKAQALQPRPTPREAPSGEEMEDAPAVEDALTREQELEMEVSDLKRDLEYAKSELQTAKTHIEQYKAISQAAEEELQNFTETNDQYREEMDKLVAEKDASTQDLQKRVDEISDVLAATNSELTALRSSQEEMTARFNEQKTILEEEVTRLKDDCERYAETAKLHQEDLRAQAEIAQQAQQNYENELVKHAEAAKNLQNVRSEYHQLKTEVAGIRAEAQAARTALSQSEESWAETRARYEREMAELNKRREDVNTQNKLLHQQLESVSEQIAALKQNRASLGEDAETSASPAPGVDSMQEVVRYLRREKEIVDVQYELSIQESKRLKQQLDHTQLQLDQTREKLNQERQSQVDKEQSAMSHSDLMKTINELNLFRESSTTLRNEARQAQSQLAAKTKEVEALLDEIQPLKGRLREVESELEMKEGELKLLQEDRDRWQQRTQTILQKYDRVDPADLESLKSQIAALQTERDNLLAEVQPLREQVEAMPAKMEAAEAALREELNKNFDERRQKLITQFKERSKDLSGKIKEKENTNKELENELQATRLARDELTQTLEAVKEELEQTKIARDEALANAGPSDVTMSNGVENTNNQVPDPAYTALSEEKSALELRLAQAESTSNEHMNRAAQLQIQVDTLQARVQELEGQVTELQQRVESTNAELNEARSAANQLPAADPEIETLKEQLASVQSELDTLRTSAAITASISNVTEDGSKPISEQVAEEVAKIKADLEAKHAERVKAAEERHQRRTDQMKRQLSTKLTEGKEAIRHQLSKEHEDAIKQLQTEHAAELDRLKTQHQAELERVKKEAEVALEGVKKETTSDVPVVAAAAAASTTEPTAEGKPTGGWKPSDAEIKDLIATSPVVKAIVTRNIQNKLSQEREALTLKVKQEQEEVMTKKLAEAAEDAEKKKSSATDMAEKKWSLKVNMAGNQLRAAQAKIEVVEQAAKETPQRDVASVWEVAKNTKPKPQNPPAVSTASQGSGQAVTTPATSLPTQPLPQPGQLQPQPGMFGQPQPGMFGRGVGQGQPFNQQSQFGANQFGQQARFNTAGRGGFGSPSISSPTTFQSPSAGLEQQTQTPVTTAINPPSTGTLPPTPQVASVNSPVTQSQPQLPTPPVQQNNAAQQTKLPNPSQPIGTGPGALRGIMNQGGTNNARGGGGVGTGIPRPAGRGQGLPPNPTQTQTVPNQTQPTQGNNTQGAGAGASQLPRGGGNTRGNRGGRGGRGGGQNGQGGLAQGSPRGNAAMNPGAKQFVPGNGKRAREDGGEEIGETGIGRGKRARGGGAAAN